MSEYSCSLSVIGAGSYGTSLAQSTASKGLPVMLWCRNPVNAQKCNRIESMKSTSQVLNSKIP